MSNNTSNISGVSFDLTGLKGIVDTFISTYKTTLESKGKRATGNLINNIKSKIKVNGKYVIISLNLEDYWKYVEYGRRPGKFPPVDKIREWIRVKPILPQPQNGKLPTANQLAFLIGRSIARNGIKPTNALKQSMNDFDLVGKIYKYFEDEFQKQISEI